MKKLIKIWILRGSLKKPWYLTGGFKTSGTLDFSGGYYNPTN